MKKILILTLVSISSLSVFAQPAYENLGAKVNSLYSEIRPTISADGNYLYFVVEGNPKNAAYKTDKLAQDIWYSTLDESGNWGQAIQAGAPVNTNKDNAIFWVSPDGNRILIRGAFDNGKYVGRGFSLCNKTENGWANPNRLKISGFNRMAVDKYMGASMANDGKTLFLYFSEEKNSFLNDIYVSKLNGDTETWSTPEKLGNNINMDDYDEISPYLASDMATMYFSSNRPGGKGDYDIWMTKRLDSTWKNWSAPVNMGDSINSAGWDAYFSVDAKGDYGYLSTTTKTLGGTDLVKTKLSESQKPKTVVMVYGKVYNGQTKEPMDAQLFYDLVPGETSEGNAIATPDGAYKVTLPYGKKYSIRASADKFFSVIDTLDFSSFGTYKEIHRDLYLYPVVEDTKVLLDSNGNVIRNNMDSIGNISLDSLKEGQILASNNILFDFGKSMLRAESYTELDKIARMMMANPDVQIELSAHTDAIGGYSENLKLSDDRAFASKQYLISKGVKADRVVSKGYGETTPVASNLTDGGRQLNRRVEFRILKM